MLTYMFNGLKNANIIFFLQVCKQSENDRNHMFILEITFLQHFQSYRKVSYIPHFQPKPVPVWEICYYLIRMTLTSFFLLFLSLHIDGGFETLNQTAQVDGPLKRAL